MSDAPSHSRWTLGENRRARKTISWYDPAISATAGASTPRA